MLVAPAGYGKTTLARQWLAGRSYAWYQGDASSSDVAALALGLTGAAGKLLPDVGRRLREWLPTSREPEQEVDVIERFLTEDLAAWPADVWFAIDDYHLLSSKAAEDLIRRLFATGPRRLLLTSRQRPEWSSARELLYGDFFELGQSSLAMTADEANEVLANGDAEAAGGLVALADGWPAVIGLAALAPGAITRGARLPERLHDYFAEELFASLPEESRDALCRLALVPTPTRAAAEAMLGPEAGRVLTVARDAGMFTTDGAEEPIFHPLLRTFLLQKLRDLPNGTSREAVDDAVELLIQAGAWGDAFSLISDFDRQDLLDGLIAEAIVPLTREGRLATLREWLEFAERERLVSPYLDLAEAEVTLRQGHLETGGVLARAAASSLDSDDLLQSLAHYRAGQSRHLVDDSLGALEHFQAAHLSARTELDAANALWGQLIVAFELESGEAPNLVDALERLGVKGRDSIARNACGRLLLAFCEGGVVPPASELSSATDLAREATDPLIRSALLRAVAGLLVLGAEYGLAFEVVDRALHDAERSNLEFVRPHTLVSRAAAHIGLRQFGDASAVLREIRAAGHRMSDPYLAANADILQCRLLLSEGSPQAALDATSGAWSRGPTPSRQMEFAVTKAAAMACAGEPREALGVLRKIKDLSRWLEPRLLLRWTKVICSVLLEEKGALEEATRAYAATAAAGAYDVFIFANRLHPAILTELATEGNVHDELAALLIRSNEERRVRALGLNIGPQRATEHHALTKRELEVYSLLAEGKSNREIGRALFISEGTAKVHVRNILRKLGVRSRTEAAVRAARTRQPEEPPE